MTLPYKGCATNCNLKFLTHEGPAAKWQQALAICIVLPFASRERLKIALLRQLYLRSCSACKMSLPNMRPSSNSLKAS